MKYGIGMIYISKLLKKSLIILNLSKGDIFNDVIFKKSKFPPRMASEGSFFFPYLSV